MEERWRRYFQKWAESEIFAEKLKKTHKRVANSNCNNPTVLFSGGKDSTVGLHIALQHYPDLLVFHYDYTFNIPRNIEEEIIENMRLLGAKRIIIEKEKAPVPDDRAFFSAVYRFLRENNVDCVFSCLRAEESVKRKTLIKERKPFQGVKNIHIIKDWTWRDVWAYIISNDLPYLSVYDKYAEVEGWDKARFTAFFSKDLDFLGKSNIDGILMWKWKNVLGGRKT